MFHRPRKRLLSVVFCVDLHLAIWLYVRGDTQMLGAGAHALHYAAAVEAIYDTATAPEKWPVALDAIAAVFDDIGANLTYQRDDGRFGVITSAALLPGQDEYLRNWSHRDVRAKRLRERNCLMWQDTATDRDLLSDQEIAADPFYNVFLASFGLRWFAVTGISPDPHTAVGISVQRSKDKSPFTPEECSTLSSLGMHAEKALRLSLRLLFADVTALGLRESLDRLGVGIFMVDGRGRVVFSNEAATELMGTAFDLSGDRLVAVAERARFEAALLATSEAAGGANPAPSPPIVISPGRSKQPVAVYILPARLPSNPIADHFTARARAIVLVLNAGGSTPADPALVRDLLGLTLGEAKLASLVATGLAPREASEKLGIAEETARTVLKRIFAKTGISRQSELATMLARLALSEGRKS
jgi:DNA-binding CsgD family transcriptional regulator/PAS domain-containing protein